MLTTKGNILTVGTQYQSIQAAIVAADAGDLIVVNPGVYEAENIILKDGIYLHFYAGVVITTGNEENGFIDNDETVTIHSTGEFPQFAAGVSQRVVLSSNSRWYHNGERLHFTYRALLSQSGTNAPTATVLENTLGGEVVWTRVGEGIYRGTLAGAFLAGKTFIPSHGINTMYCVSGFSGSPLAGSKFILLQRESDNYVEMRAGDDSGVYDDQIAGFSIEILVYP